MTLVRVPEDLVVHMVIYHILSLSDAVSTWFLYTKIPLRYEACSNLSYEATIEVG
jgi:hypothetical protein